MDFAEAFVMLADSVHFRDAVDLDIPRARVLMAFAANVLKAECPPIIPTICLNEELSGDVVGSFVKSIKIITLKRWNRSCYDQGVLVHELAHYVQQFNGMPFCEKQAITAQCLWLRSIGAYPDDYPSARAIVKMTGDKAFATLDWLEAV